MLKTICVDFDGVIYPNFRYFSVAVLRGGPVEGTVEALRELSKQYRVVIHSARCAEPVGVKAIQDWLARYGMEYEVSINKPRAHIYIDDRAVKFTGSWLDTLGEIKSFKQWQADDKLRAKIMRKRAKRR